MFRITQGACTHGYMQHNRGALSWVTAYCDGAAQTMCGLWRRTVCVFPAKYQEAAVAKFRHMGAAWIEATHCESDRQ